MTERYAAEDIWYVAIRRLSRGPWAADVVTDLTPAQRAAVAVALERPEDVLKAMMCHICTEMWTGRVNEMWLCDKCQAEYYEDL